METNRSEVAATQIYYQSSTGKIHQQGCGSLSIGRSFVSKISRSADRGAVVAEFGSACCRRCFRNVPAAPAPAPAAAQADRVAALETAVVNGSGAVADTERLIAWMKTELDAKQAGTETGSYVGQNFTADRLAADLADATGRLRRQRDRLTLALKNLQEARG